MSSNLLLEARGLLRLAQGRTREGVDDLLEFGRRDELSGEAQPARLALALARSRSRSQRSERREHARRMAPEDLERARRWGAASGIGVALRATALVEGGAAALDRLRESAKVLAGLTRPARARARPL